MRTTLTLDDDVAARLKRVQAEQGLTLKEAVNTLIRRGLDAAEPSSKSRRRFRTPTADLGELMVGSIDDVADALALAEGDDFK